MKSRTIAAWGVHGVTASGAALSLLALDAVARQQWRPALAWMVGAMIVDSIDGMLARLVDVREALPGFDGSLLDNVIDYFGYVVVPAFLVLRSDLVPPGTGFLAGSGMLLASAYQFCQPEAKTVDHFFKGFPSFWNVTVLYLFLLPTSPEMNLTTLAILGLLAFVPLRWAYPSRMLQMRTVTVLLTILWIVSLLLLLYHPEPPGWLLALSLLYLLYYVGVSLWLSARTGKLLDGLPSTGDGPGD